MISTVTNRGTLRFMIYKGALNVLIFLSFLRRLIKDARRKVFLIVDNLRVHWARSGIAWVEANRKVTVRSAPPGAAAALATIPFRQHPADPALSGPGRGSTVAIHGPV